MREKKKIKEGGNRDRTLDTCVEEKNKKKKKKKRNETVDENERKGRKII